jgi:hypothetical protein
MVQVNAKNEINLMLEPSIVKIQQGAQGEVCRGCHNMHRKLQPHHQATHGHYYEVELPPSLLQETFLTTCKVSQATEPFSLGY